MSPLKVAIGIQNYTTKIVRPDGNIPVLENCKVTQMGYEYYPELIGNVNRYVASQILLPILVTENGVAIDCDERRVELIDRDLISIKKVHPRRYRSKGISALVLARQF